MDWKDKLNSLYSTNPELTTPAEEDSHDDIVQTDDSLVPNSKMILRIEIDKRNRKGKTVTLVSGYLNDDEELAKLAKVIKAKCGSGGSSRCGEILIQGDFRQKINEILLAEGFKTKVIK